MTNEQTTDFDYDQVARDLGESVPDQIEPDLSSVREKCLRLLNWIDSVRGVNAKAVRLAAVRFFLSQATPSAAVVTQTNLAKSLRVKKATICRACSAFRSEFMLDALLSAIPGMRSVEAVSHMSSAQRGHKQTRYSKV